MDSQQYMSRIERTPSNMTPYSNCDSFYKIVLIGQTCSGKTSMLLRFTDRMFSDSYQCTIGVDFKVKYLNVDSRPVKV
jgi:Ras-related protein Rab-1A